jgi:polyhydroxybutyrate depolymerase
MRQRRLQRVETIISRTESFAAERRLKCGVVNAQMRAALSNAYPSRARIYDKTKCHPPRNFFSPRQSCLAVRNCCKRQSFRACGHRVSLGRIDLQGIFRIAGRTSFAISLILGSCAMARACDASTPCPVDGGEYFVSLPKGWDRQEPLPAVVFFHGHNGSAEEVLADAPLVRALSDANVALVVPQGQKGARGVRSWSFPGGQTLPRDDFVFVERVRKDMAARWPIDPARTLASGFSAGGSLVWYVACRMPQLFAAYAPVAGAFWAPEPETCAEPVSLRHIHGTNDRTVPIKGRSLRGGTMKQGDVMKSFETLKQLDACPATAAQNSKTGPLSCETWPARTCASGRELVLCLHDGEHEIDPAWVLEGAQWLATLASKPAH